MNVLRAVSACCGSLSANLNNGKNDLERSSPWWWPAPDPYLLDDDPVSTVFDDNLLVAVTDDGLVAMVMNVRVVVVVVVMPEPFLDNDFLIEPWSPGSSDDHLRELIDRPIG